MWGVTWDSVIDQSSKWEATFFFHFYARSSSVPFLNCLNLHNFCFFHSAKQRIADVSPIQILRCCLSSLEFKLVIKEAILPPYK